MTECLFGCGEDRFEAFRLVINEFDLILKLLAVVAATTAATTDAGTVATMLPLGGKHWHRRRRVFCTKLARRPYWLFTPALWQRHHRLLGLATA
jgi:hypothetical protein